VVECLVQKCGADVNQVNQNGTPPLHMAAQNGHLEVVRCLVKELGADVNQVKNEGRTALHELEDTCQSNSAGADCNLAN
jgi:ankyrin repeat protein